MIVINLIKGKTYSYLHWMLIMSFAAFFSLSCNKKENFPNDVKTSGQQAIGPGLPVPSFTVTPSQDNPNLVIVDNTTLNTSKWLWDFGNGETSDKEKDSTLYMKKGDYQITLRVFGPGGDSSLTKTVNIADDYSDGHDSGPDGNVLDMRRGGDIGLAVESAWKTVKMANPDELTDIKFSDTGIVFSNSGGSNGGIYRPLIVDEGNYGVYAHVKGSGATNAWFEIHFGDAAPKQGVDYKDDKYMGINTWSGCGKTPFEGNLADISCDGKGIEKGMVSFAKSDTVFLIVKAGCSLGAGTLGKAGITLDTLRLIKY